MEYRTHGSPGCGGCLIIIGLFVLLFGGFPALVKFLGYIVVTVMAGFLLLVAGMYAFSYYIRQKISTYEATKTESHKKFVHLLVHILVKIAQLDGRFTKAELATMTNFFRYSLRYDQDQMYWVKQLIKDARNADYSMDELLMELKSGFGYEARLILLELIYQIIYLKSPVDDKELAEARRIAAFLEVRAYDLRTIEAKYMYGDTGGAGSSGGASYTEEQYYAVLGLANGVGFVEIKKAYRKLSMKYHPDKVSHLGEEFKKVSEEKMKEINAAYDYFKKKYGER